MSISRIEKGAQRPSAELAERIAAWTKGQVSAASLVGLGESGDHRSVREEGVAFETKPVLSIEIPIAADQARVLRTAGVDVEAVARAGAEKALKEAEAKAWAEANREAIDAYNVWIDKHGTLAEQLGMI